MVDVEVVVAAVAALVVVVLLIVVVVAVLKISTHDEGPSTSGQLRAEAKFEHRMWPRWNVS